MSNNDDVGKVGLCSLAGRMMLSDSAIGSIAAKDDNYKVVDGCKQNQDFHKKFQEKEGDAEGLASRQQIKWIGRVHTFMGNSVLKVLDKKSDSHILQIQMEHMDTKPYFKIQGYMVTSLASLAQERASLHQMMVTELQKAKSAAGKDGSYGLVMFDCTNNKKLPALSTVTFTEGICDYTYSLPMDVLVQLINLGRF
eukprot:gene20896-27746_t